MLSKFANRIMRRSVQQKSPKSPTSPTSPTSPISPTLPTSSSLQLAQQVDIAPELLRWSDFSTPFPSVSVGGYTRFYATHKMSESMESLYFCPLLSQSPEPSPLSEIPLKSPLFATLQRRCLPMIQEVSLESLTPNKPRNLTISTCAIPYSRSLKRRRRRMFRNPSVERDFVQGPCQSPSNTSITISELSTSSSTDIAPSPCSISSTDSHLSHEQSDPELPITPSTSIETNVERFSAELLDNKLSPAPHDESESVTTLTTRPISSISLCTAKLDSDI